MISGRETTFGSHSAVRTQSLLRIPLIRERTLLLYRSTALLLTYYITVGCVLSA